MVEHFEVRYLKVPLTRKFIKVNVNSRHTYNCTPMHTKGTTMVADNQITYRDDHAEGVCCVAVNSAMVFKKASITSPVPQTGDAHQQLMRLESIKLQLLVGPGVEASN